MPTPPPISTYFNIWSPVIGIVAENIEALEGASLMEEICQQGGCGGLKLALLAALSFCFLHGVKMCSLSFLFLLLLHDMPSCPNGRSSPLKL